MDHASRQTALFFGFLTAAMTAASAQAAPVQTAAQTDVTAVHRTAAVQDIAARPEPAKASRATQRSK